MESILEALIAENLSNKLQIEDVSNDDELLHKYVIKPLTPSIANKNCIIFNNNKKIKKKDLLTRLIYTVKKSNQYEQNKDKSIDILRLNTEDSLSEEKEILSQDITENIKSIVQSAQEYIIKLNYQLKDLDDADQQIENSTTEILKGIDETFQSLLDDVCQEINNRREQLILETEIQKHESLIPLKACRKEVMTQIQNAQSIIALSENMLQRAHQYNENRFEQVIVASNSIGRLPAVPYSEELPNINFNCASTSCRAVIIEQISRLGHISRTIPVQIMNIEERPGGLFIKWDITDPEYTAEEQIFVVEKANGEIFDQTSNEFETIYKGSETFCFIKNLIVNQPVTVRVRIQTDNVEGGSIHHVTRTTLSPYSWELNNRNYRITNDKIAVKLTDNISTLFSHGPQFDANHIIEFKFLEVSQEGNDDEGIGLVFDPQDNHDTLKRTASLLITPRGKIFIDGNEKLMRLPRIRSGSQILISALRKDAHVLRVNIESENKCVTYDWRVQTPLHFAARFIEHEKLIIMIK